MMTAEKLIKLLLELDQQIVNPRPSMFAEAAQLVHTLCEHAEPSMRNPALLGDWEGLDMRAIPRFAPRELDQPILDEIQSLDARDA